MKDPRLTVLAHNLIQYSCRLQKGEHVLIEANGIEDALIGELVDAAYEVGGYPHVQLHEPSVKRRWLMGAMQEVLELEAEIDAARMKKMNAYIGLRSGSNASELSDVPGSQMDLYTRLYNSVVHGTERIAHTKWVVLRYPSPSMAQQAGMSTEAFEEYYFNVCCLDYAKMDKAMDALKTRMQKTDVVRLVGPGTDLSFSIKGIPVIKCAGTCNIPDGEIYTAPIRDSINGTISYNTPSLYNGFTYENICFTFQDGKIVQATANDTKRINQVLDTDEGARYVGEFSFGVNPYITKPMKDTLFDEKISGSIHLTPGACYDEAPNGNRSAIHWDLVLIQTPEFGGGEIWFDNDLIRKDGRFVSADLLCLNPEHLK